jgi:uncharacterized repeat protein (TIGR01451 family)
MHRRRFATAVGILGLLASMLTVSGVALAANQAANLDQCANDAAPSSPMDGCDGSASQWVNGNLGASKSIYREGDSIPYRMRFTNIRTGSAIHTVILEYDTTKAGKHAIDYLTDWNRTVTTANPCLGAGCSLGAPSSTRAIPVDPQVKAGPNGTTPNADDINPGPDGTPGTADDATNCTTPNLPCTGIFTMWGGSITSVSSITYPDGAGFAGDKTARLTVSFSASTANPVLAWGGHIATRQQWPNASAIDISGSPYHMRLIDLDGAGGNQDRSLSADAVVFPGSITVVKHADPASSTAFGFTTSAGLTPSTFNLTDSSSTTDPSQLLDDTAAGVGITNFGTYTVTEDAATSWDLASRSCVVDASNGGSTAASGTRGVSVTIKEGENWVCTFTNTPSPAPALNIVKSATESSVDAAGDVIHYTITVENTGNVTLTNVTVTDPFADADSIVRDATDVVGDEDNLLEVGETWGYTATHTVTQAEIDAGGNCDGDDEGTAFDALCNTATADSTETGPDTDDAVVPVSQDPRLVVTKDDDYADGQKYENVGDVIGYSITVENTGNVTLTNVVVTDVNADAGSITRLADIVGDEDNLLEVGEKWSFSATHTVTQADLTAGSVVNAACADDGEGGAEEDCDDVETPGKAQPTITTADVLIPQDSITIAGLTADAEGWLYVELQIDGDCGDENPAYSKTWTFGDAVPANAFTGNGTYDTANTLAVSTDATIRWCTEYSGDANNAARPLSDRGEVVKVDFDPIAAGAIGAAIPMLAWGLWTLRKKREDESR